MSVYEMRWNDVRKGPSYECIRGFKRPKYTVVQNPSLTEDLAHYSQLTNENEDIDG